MIRSGQPPQTMVVNLKGLFHNYTSEVEKGEDIHWRHTAVKDWPFSLMRYRVSVTTMQGEKEERFYIA